MRTTVRIDDELLRSLKEQARSLNVSLTRLLDRTLRAGMRAANESHRPRRRYREHPSAMGMPSVSLDKALALAAALENGEIVRKMKLRK